MCEVKISVIIPVYNVEKYLERSVHSIINQTYGNLEIILVDDGSTDDSGRLCDILAQKDGRIRVLHKNNGGLSSARNAGLEIAEGEYIYFLDSDDYVKRNLLEDCINNIGDAEFISFGYEAVDEQDNKLGEMEFSKGEYQLTTEEATLRFISQLMFKYRIAWSAWSKVFRMSVIRENDLRFVDNNEIFAEDLLFVIMYLLCSEKVKCVEQKYYLYVKRSDSIMHTIKDTKLNEMIQLGKYLERFIEDKGLNYIAQNYSYLFHLILSDRVKSLHARRVSEITKGISRENYAYLCQKYHIDHIDYQHSRQQLGLKTRIERVLYGKMFIDRSNLALQVNRMLNVFSALMRH